MRHFSSLFIVLGVCLLAISCATLRPVTLTQKDSILDYQYIYITPTAAVNSTSGGVYGGSYGVYGATSTKTADPASLISGYFLKKGFTRLPELTPELLDKTLVVNYGESGQRGVFWGKVTEITIQFLSAKTMQPVFVTTGEGFGETEADDIRQAINRCLDKLFEK